MTRDPEWREVTIGDMCEFRYGKSLPESARVPGDFRVFGSNGPVGSHNVALTSGPAVIIGRKGSFGEVTYSADSCWPIDTTYYVDRASTNADLRWLFHRLSAAGLKQMNRAAAVPGLNREDAYRKRILLPPPLEQKRIASILDAAEALRDKRRQANAKLEELRKAAFLGLFGDPVRNPRGWPQKRLSEVGALDRGVSKHRPRNAPELLDGPHALIQTGDVANSGGYVDTYHQTYTESGLRQSKKWPAGTLCITIAANIAKSGILMFDACFPDSVVGFTPGDAVTTEYVQTWLSFLQSDIEHQAPQVAQKNINLEILRDLSIPVPEMSLQSRFDDLLRAMNDVRAAGRQSQRVLADLAESLQHRAFRGEL